MQERRGEISMSNTQARQTQAERGRPRNVEPPKFVQLMLPRELHRKIKAQAAADGQELNPWIRWVCLQELRRRKKPSL
jgi:predicted HicB family RNase H-like nuclease